MKGSLVIAFTVLCRAVQLRDPRYRDRPSLRAPDRHIGSVGARHNAATPRRIAPVPRNWAAWGSKKKGAGSVPADLRRGHRWRSGDDGLRHVDGRDVRNPWVGGLRSTWAGVLPWFRRRLPHERSPTEGCGGLAGSEGTFGSCKYATISSGWRYTRGRRS